MSILSKFGNYYHLLHRNDDELFILTSYEDKVLSMISLELTNGKRIHELILLELLLDYSSIDKATYLNELDKRGVFYNQDVLNSVKRIFTLVLYTKTDIEKYDEKKLIQFEKNQVYLNESIRESLRKNKDYRKLLEDAVQTGFLKAKQYKQNKRLTLYEKYTK